MKTTRLITEIEDEFLNVNRALSDGELLQATKDMNKAYLERTGQSLINYPWSPFELEEKRIKESLTGYDLENPMDRKQFNKVVINRLIQWVKKHR